jgi:hypothetical protein
LLKLGLIKLVNLSRRSRWEDSFSLSHAVVSFNGFELRKNREIVTRWGENVTSALENMVQKQGR